MSKIQTSLRLDEEALRDAKEILETLGMNFTQAVNIFTNMVVQSKGLPFEVKIPNQETIKVIQETRQGINVEDFSLKELQGK